MLSTSFPFGGDRLCADAAHLTVVAVRSAKQAHALDLLHWKGFDLLLVVPDEPEPTDATAIREGDVLAVRFQLPARLLVLDGAVVMLETGIAFLAGFVVLAIVIEAFDGEPGA